MYKKLELFFLLKVKYIYVSAPTLQKIEGLPVDTLVLKVEIFISIETK